MAIKGILWSIIFIITSLIYYIIPTYLIFIFWIPLNEMVDWEGRPIYTYALFALFFFIVSLLVALIYSVAAVRAILQRKNPEGLGIPKGVKGFGLVSTIFVCSLMIIWYLLFNEIAIFSLTPP
jgi:hypothetical protein